LLDPLVSLASSSILELTSNRSVVENLPGCRPGTLVELFDKEGHRCRGLVETVWGRQVEIALIDEPTEISRSRGMIRVLSQPASRFLSLEVIGRALDPLGEPLDGLPKPISRLEALPDDSRFDLDRVPLKKQLLLTEDDIDSGFPLMVGSTTLLLGADRTSLWNTSRRILSSVMNANPSTCVIVARGELNIQEKDETLSLYKDTGQLVRMVLLLGELGDPYSKLGLFNEQALALGEKLAFQEGQEVLLLLDPGVPSNHLLTPMEAFLNKAGLSARKEEASLTVLWLAAQMPGDPSIWRERADVLLFFEEKDGSLHLVPDRCYSRFTG